jgi:hypothetical protein
VSLIRTDDIDRSEEVRTGRLPLLVVFLLAAVVGSFMWWGLIRVIGALLG